MAVSFKINFDDRVWYRFAQARERGQDLRPALRAIGRANVADTRRRFLTKRAPDGSPWRPSRNPKGTTLVDEAHLRNSITALEPSQGAVEVGSNRAYAGVHQAGIDRNVNVRAHERTTRTLFGRRLNAPVTFTIDGHVRRMRIVARPYLGASPAEMDRYGAILLRHIGEPLSGARR